MAILRGTSQTRFPSFDDPNSGIGAVFDRAQDSIRRFVTEVTPNIFRDTFVEDGAQNAPGISLYDPSWSNVKQPTRRTVLTQRPKATVFVKKRMFSSLRNNFDVRFMDDNEKLFMRAVKNLFRRKCEEIAFYENLISLERIFDNNTGFLNINEFLDNYLESFLSVLEVGFGLTQGIGGALEFLGQGGFVNDLQEGLTAFFGEDPVLATSAEIIQKLYRLREINKRSKSNMFTTWIVDEKTADYSGLGPGTGTIELNLVSSLNTTSSLLTGKGKCDLTIQDPYRLLLINEGDIEIALRQSLVESKTASGTFDVTGTLQLKQAEVLDRELNASRRTRGVSEINFEFVFGTENEVQGIVVETGEVFNERTVSQVSVEQALTAPETVRALQIIGKMRSYKDLQRRGLNQFHLNSEELNAPRKRMRNEFLGHSVIQQMDSIYVFMNGQTRDETPVYSGKLDVSPAEFISSLQQKTDAISSETIRKEWEVLAGPGIPYELYAAMRNPSFFRGDGVSTFVGLVTNVNFSYRADPGTFTISVSANDNTEYLKISRLLKSPSLSQPQGILEDPLTPFDLTTEASSGLLTKVPELSDANKKRLRFLRFDDGDEVGRRVEQGSALFRDSIFLDDNREIAQFDDVPGLVYTWKEGIISATLNINSLRGPSGAGTGLAELQDVFGVTVTNDPFANLDSADIVSILVTGRPHNYSSFLKSAVDSGTFSIDSTNNNRFFFNFLFDFLGRQQEIAGNFVPAKPEVLDPQSAADTFRAKIQLDGTVRQLALLNRRRAELLDRRRAAETDVFAERADDSLRKVNERISELNAEVERVRASLPEAVNVGIFGNSVHLDIENEEDIRGINRRLSYRLKRKPEEVRYNQDKNFFIVSDKYDLDTDIQAFTLALKESGPSLWSNKNPGSDYENPLSICTRTAKTIDFEFFADPDGNIQFRPPQYNRTPLSLLIRLININQGDRSALIPDFLLDLFDTRLALIEREILVRDLELLENLLLINTDPTVFGLQLAIQLNPASGVYELNSSTLRSLSFEDEIFSPDQQANDAQNDLSIVNTDGSGGGATERLKKIIGIRNQIADLTGKTTLRGDSESVEDRQVVLDQLKQFNGAFDENSEVNKQRIKDKIAQSVAGRQLLIKAYRGLVVQGGDLTVQGGSSKYNEIKRSLASWASAASGSPLGIPRIPKFLQDLIENDMQNDEGFRSGKRFVIYDDVIESMDLSVNAPEYNRVDVQGDVDIVGGKLTGSIPQLFWAGATDFDSWRQFGYRGHQEYHRADFSDPETQCAPYAVFKLLQQRKNIHRGTITIVGNEFYRPGDVVYIVNKSMLYYVETVNHNLEFQSGRFVTKLTLTYGRTLGEYIPTPLDVIGKGVLSNKKRAFSEIRSNRKAVPQSANVFALDTLFVESANTLITDPTQTGLETNNRQRTKFIEQNQPRIKNAIVRASSRINDRNRDDAFIEIRSYYIRQFDPVTGQEIIDNNSLIRARTINKWVADLLLSPAFQDDLSTTEKLTVSKIRKVVTDIAADLSNVDRELRRFPTSSAWSGANKSGFSQGGVPLPLNAIDIAFVVDKSRRGDKSASSIVESVDQSLVGNVIGG